MIIPGVVAHASRPVPTIVTGAATSTTTVPTVTTSAATNYNQNSATLNGSTSVGTISYLWGTTSSPSTALSSSSLTGLSSNTTYYFRAVGTNNAATASLAGTVSATSPTTVSFEWGTSSGVYPNVASVGTYSNVTSQAVSASISGLTPGTTYYYRIRATNTVGFTYGSEQSFVAANTTANGSVLSFTTYQFRSVTYTATGSGTWTNPTPTNGASIDTVYNLVLIGGGASEAGGSGQGRLLTSYNFGGGNVSYSIGGSDQSTNFKDQTAIAGVKSLYSLGSSGDGFSNGSGESYQDFFQGYLYSGVGGGGGAAGAGTNGYLVSYTNPFGGSGGPANTLSWTGIDGTSRSYAYGGGGAGVGIKQDPVTTYVNAGAAGGYGGAWNGNGTANRGGGGGYLGSGGSGYIYFEYWGP